jgi:hypothetical protein
VYTNSTSANEAAQDHISLLKELTQSGQVSGHIAKALYVEGLCLKASGEQTRARQAWQQATILAHETGQQMLIWQLHAAQATIADNAKVAAVHQRIAAEMLEQIVYPIEDEKLRQKFLSAVPVRAVLQAAEKGEKHGT